MPWFNDLVSAVTGSKKDCSEIKAKIQSAKKGTMIPDTDIEEYIEDINSRVKSMVKELKTIYKKYDIQFMGFKALETACFSLGESLKTRKEESYNNLLKLESSITAEQKRHLSLIRMAVTKDGKKVLDRIMQDPTSKNQYIKVFGSRAITGTDGVDGTYQGIWSEINKVAEYVITHKNKVYH